MYTSELQEFINKIKHIEINEKSVNIVKDVILNILDDSEIQDDNTMNNEMAIQLINIEQINKKFFKMGAKVNSKNNSFCTLCQYHIKKGEHKTSLCNCKHTFHKKCLNKYMKIKKLNFECPICKKSYKNVLHKIAENCNL